MPENNLHEAVQRNLAELCRRLGSPEHDWAILGEGNASERIDGQSFYVKASGCSMATLTTDQLVRVSSAPLVKETQLKGHISDTDVESLLQSVVLDGSTLRPSVESLIHAYLLTLDGITVVGHTHVTAINALLCSRGGWDAVNSGRRLYPDEIVVCGQSSCCVPYTDPGIPLARAVRKAVTSYLSHFGAPPKTIYLQNHGFIALGRSTAEVLAITSMAEKSAKIMLAAYNCGGLHFLSEDEVSRIATRPDEKYRQKALGLRED